MQQRILHGVTAVKAFISPLNHNGSSQCFFFFVFFLLSWCFMEFRGPVFCLFGFLSHKRRFSFIKSFFFYFIGFIRRRDGLSFFFVGQSKHGCLFMSRTHGWFRPLVGCRGGVLGRLAGDWRRRDFHLSDADLNKRVQILWAGVTAFVSLQWGSRNLGGMLLLKTFGIIYNVSTQLSKISNKTIISLIFGIFGICTEGTSRDTELSPLLSAFFQHRNVPAQAFLRLPVIVFGFTSTADMWMQADTCLCRAVMRRRRRRKRRPGTSRRYSL